MKAKGLSKLRAPSPLQLLCCSLSRELRRNCFGELKTCLLQLGLEKLDFKLNTTEQPDVLLEIQTKLEHDFPKVFFGPHAARRLQYARQVLIQQHGNQRSKRGLANKRLRRADKENVANDVLDLTLSDDSDEESTPGLSRTPQRERAKSRAVTSEPRIRSRWTYSTPTNQAGDPSILSSVSAQRPATAPKASTSHSSSSSSQVDAGKRGIDHIDYFLKSCSPPLGYLVSQFVELGFKSVVLLTEVACQWTPAERRELLKKLQVPQSGHVSELELIALERRFQKYNLEILNGM